MMPHDRLTATEVYLTLSLEEVLREFRAKAVLVGHRMKTEYPFGLILSIHSDGSMRQTSPCGLVICIVLSNCR